MICYFITILSTNHSCYSHVSRLGSHTVGHVFSIHRVSRGARGKGQLHFLVMPSSFGSTARLSFLHKHCSPETCGERSLRTVFPSENTWCLIPCLRTTRSVNGNITENTPESHLQRQQRRRHNNELLLLWKILSQGFPFRGCKARL